MLAEKKLLDLDLIETQSAVELPDRTLPLVTIVIGNVLSGNTIDVDVRNINVALQVCAVVSDINALLVEDNADSVVILSCEIEQRNPGGG